MDPEEVEIVCPRCHSHSKVKVHEAWFSTHRNLMACNTKCPICMVGFGCVFFYFLPGGWRLVANEFVPAQTVSA